MPGREWEWSGAAERPWYTKGIERAERFRPVAGAPRPRWREGETWRERGERPERRREGRAGRAAPPGYGVDYVAEPSRRTYGARDWRHPARERPSYGEEHGPYGERYEAYGEEYGAYGDEYWTRYGPEFTARRRFRRRGWGRARYVPASEVPRGRRERWWYAIGPERRMDYDWAYSARRPELYGWTGETGRDGGPGDGPGGWQAGGRRRGRDGGWWMRRRRRRAW